MTNEELKPILQETSPVLPGQEARAWMLLQERWTAGAVPSRFAWRQLVSFGLGVLALVLIAVHFSAPAPEIVSAASKSPGIFASAFYSQPAHAQVVWLNGMEPAKDGPTYMDRTGTIKDETAKATSPDSL